MNTLSISNSFSAQRFLLLVKRTLFLNRRTWLIGFASVFGVLFMIWLHPMLTGAAPWHSYRAGELLPLAMILFLLGGYLITSRIFHEFNAPSTAFLQLTLPATALEKLTCAWVVTAPLYTLVCFIAFTLFINVLQFFSNLFTGLEVSYFWMQLFSADVLANVALYFIYHAAFLLGAVWFKKNQFIKTVLSIIAVAIVFMFAFGMFFLVLASQATSSFQAQAYIYHEPVYLLVQAMLGISLLAAAYIRLKNKQIV